MRLSFKPKGYAMTDPTTAATPGDAKPIVTIKVSHRFDVPPERVFDAWLDSRNAGKWLFATEGGQMLRVDIAPRVGSGFTIVERRGDHDVAHWGTFIEIDKPRRLAFLFSVDKFETSSTRVTVEIMPLLDSGCELTLMHDGVWVDYADRTKEGWEKILGNLEKTLT